MFAIYLTIAHLQSIVTNCLYYLQYIYRLNEPVNRLVSRHLPCKMYSKFCDITIPLYTYIYYILVIFFSCVSSFLLYDVANVQTVVS